MRCPDSREQNCPSHETCGGRIAAKNDVVIEWSANRKLARKGLVGSAESVSEVREGTGKPTIMYRLGGFEFVLVLPVFLSGASLGALVRRHRFRRVHRGARFELRRRRKELRT